MTLHLANGRVQHKAVDLLVDGDDQHGGAAVESITTGNQFSTRSQSSFGSDWTVIGLLKDTKDGANGDEAVNVGGPIQGVKGDDVLALSLRLDLDGSIVFLRHQETAEKEDRAGQVDVNPN